MAESARDKENVIKMNILLIISFMVRPDVVLCMQVTQMKCKVCLFSQEKWIQSAQSERAPFEKIWNDAHLPWTTENGKVYYRLVECRKRATILSRNEIKKSQNKWIEGGTSNNASTQNHSIIPIIYHSIILHGKNLSSPILGFSGKCKHPRIRNEQIFSMSNNGKWTNLIINDRIRFSGCSTSIWNMFRSHRLKLLFKFIRADRLREGKIAPPYISCEFSEFSGEVVT